MPAEGSIAGYEAFRERAAQMESTDFPELAELADGGVFAMRLDEIVPPTLRPFEEVRDEVLADWRRAEVQRQLLELAADLSLAEVAQTEATPDEAQADDASAWTTETGLARSDWMDGLPPQLLSQAFAVTEPGQAEVVDAGDRVFVVRLDQINDADLSQPDAAQVLDGVRSRLDQSLQVDLFDYYARYAQRQSAVELNQSAINAINAQVQ